MSKPQIIWDECSQHLAFPGNLWKVGGRLCFCFCVSFLLFFFFCLFVCWRYVLDNLNGCLPGRVCGKKLRWKSCTWTLPSKSILGLVNASLTYSLHTCTCISGREVYTVVPLCTHACVFGAAFADAWHPNGGFCLKRSYKSKHRMLTRKQLNCKYDDRMVNCTAKLIHQLLFLAMEHCLLQ